MICQSTYTTRPSSEGRLDFRFSAALPCSAVPAACVLWPQQYCGYVVLSRSFALPVLAGGLLITLLYRMGASAASAYGWYSATRRSSVAMCCSASISSFPAYRSFWCGAIMDMWLRMRYNNALHATTGNAAVESVTPVSFDGFISVVRELGRSAALLESTLCIFYRDPLLCASKTGHTILAFHHASRQMSVSSSRSVGMLTPPQNNALHRNCRPARHARRLLLIPSFPFRSTDAVGGSR